MGSKDILLFSLNSKLIDDSQNLEANVLPNEISVEPKDEDISAV